MNTERDKYEQLLIIEKTSHLEKSIDSGAIIKKKLKETRAETKIYSLRM